MNIVTDNSKVIAELHNQLEQANQRIAEYHKIVENLVDKKISIQRKELKLRILDRLEARGLDFTQLDKSLNKIQADAMRFVKL